MVPFGQVCTIKKYPHTAEDSNNEVKGKKVSPSEE